jgi:uncharacterized protein YbjT (DUF2867 family)
LIAAGFPVRVFARDQQKSAHWGDKVERVLGDLGEPATLTRLFDGAGKLFCLSFIDQPPELDRGIIEGAARAGIRQIVKLSTIGAAAPGEVAVAKRHREREQWIEASGIPWTFVRPGFFMSNALRWAPLVKTQGKVFTPSAEGATTPISPHDIAEVARMALTGSGQAGKTYELTGGEVLTARQQTAVLASVLGKPLECIELPMESVLKNQRKSGMPEWLLESMAALWTSVRAGKGGFQNETFRQVTGHAPQTFETWCQENRAAFE